MHVPSAVIDQFDPDWGASLLGDKAHSMIFDNTKIKRYVPDYVATVPFARGAEEIIAWYDEDASRRTINEASDRQMDEIVRRAATASPDGG